VGGLLVALAIEQATIVAHDIGGAIGQRFAIAHPERVRRLMIIDTVSYDSWPSETWRKIIEEQMEEHRQLPQEAFDALLTRQLEMTVADGAATMTGDVLDAYLAPHRSALGRISFFEHQVRHYDSRYTEEITDQLASLTMPVRILWGERDQWQPLTYARQLAEDIPGARLTVIPGAGHFVMEDAPERVTEEILNFLAD
jgi:pimeloyl-ACP methyl ester carboxylesterase